MHGVQLICGTISATYTRIGSSIAQCPENSIHVEWNSSGADALPLLLLLLLLLLGPLDGVQSQDMIAGRLSKRVTGRHRQRDTHTLAILGYCRYLFPIRDIVV